MRLSPLISASVFLLGLGGCVVRSTSDPPIVDTSPVVVDGTWILDWTIDGSTDPNRCNQSSSTTLEILVEPSAGGQASSYSSWCDSFAASIDLAPGDYFATAVLVDAGGNARTTTLDIDPFRILGNDELRTPIDFPASSFK